MLTLAEELEDKINEKMEGLASFSSNPDEAIAIAMQQKELAKYNKTRKKTEVCQSVHNIPELYVIITHAHC